MGLIFKKKTRTGWNSEFCHVVITVKFILDSPNDPLEIDLLFQQEWDRVPRWALLFVRCLRSRGPWRAGSWASRRPEGCGLGTADSDQGREEWDGKSPVSLEAGIPRLSGIPLPSEDAAQVGEEGLRQMGARGVRGKNNPKLSHKPGEPLSGEPWPGLEITIILKESLATQHFKSTILQ